LKKPLRRGERFTFEYVLLGGVNDADEHARSLANLLNKHDLKKVKINLIPHNSAEPLEYRPPEYEQVEKFKNILESKGVSAYVRRPRGRDIYAAVRTARRQRRAESRAGFKGLEFNRGFEH
jgi:23S rRNA (adenine2503-C2)-methyltransferase